MRTEASAGKGPSSKHPRERLFQNGRPRGPANKFGTIVRALWPDKPALNLAQRIGCSERAANFYITGERKVTALAVAAIVNEIVAGES